MSTPTLLIVMFAVAVIVVASIVGYVNDVLPERRRRAALRAWARHNGWRYTRRPKGDWVARLPRSSYRSVTLALSGTVDGRAVVVAEYGYVTSEPTIAMMDTGDWVPSSISTTHHLIGLVVSLDPDTMWHRVHHDRDVDGEPQWKAYPGQLVACRPGRIGHPDFVPDLVAPLVRAAERLGSQRTSAS